MKEQYDLVAHSGYIISLATSKCGKFIISSSKDNTIRFWDTRDRKQAIVLNERNYNFTHVTAIGSGKSIVFGTDTGRVGIWRQDLSSF
jgi:WD40 repeat protein